MDHQTVWKYNFFGWILFCLSALFFTYGALLAGDVIALVASLLFLIACVFFMIPLWIHRKRP